MRKLLLLLLVSILLPACSTTPKINNPVQNANNIAPYPDAMDGYTRYAIHLPSLANENKARVEVLIGKEINTDCNTRSLGGIVKQEELKGWGYNYYVVDKANNDISTLMACPEGTNKNQFVTMNHNLGLLDYNSRLPIVFYVPNDLTVKYRIWQTGSKVLQASAE